MERFILISQEQKLKQVLDYAIERGYTCLGKSTKHFSLTYEYDIVNKDGGTTSMMELNTLIFSHEFCKAVFGEEETKVYGVTGMVHPHLGYTTPAWKYEIQQLAVAENRIDYLFDFINGD